MCPFAENQPNQHSLDRRKMRTRRQLSSALFALMLEKSYESITIEEITQRADLGRTTFYLHYRDKEDLLLGSIEATAEELKEQVLEEMSKESNTVSDDYSSQPAPGLKAIAMIFQHTAEHTSLYLPILRGEGTPRAPARIRQIISQGAYDFFVNQTSKRDQSKETEIPVEILTNFFSSSLLGMLTWWLENDLPYSSEEIAIIYRTLFAFGARQALGNITT